MLMITDSQNELKISKALTGLEVKSTDDFDLIFVPDVNDDIYGIIQLSFQGDSRKRKILELLANDMELIWHLAHTMNIDNLIGADNKNLYTEVRRLLLEDKYIRSRYKHVIVSHLRRVIARIARDITNVVELRDTNKQSGYDFYETKEYSSEYILSYMKGKSPITILTENSLYEIYGLTADEYDTYSSIFTTTELYNWLDGAEINTTSFNDNDLELTIAHRFRDRALLINKNDILIDASIAEDFLSLGTLVGDPVGFNRNSISEEDQKDKEKMRKYYKEHYDRQMENIILENKIKKGIYNSNTAVDTYFKEEINKKIEDSIIDKVYMFDPETCWRMITEQEVFKLFCSTVTIGMNPIVSERIAKIFDGYPLELAYLRTSQVECFKTVSPERIVMHTNIMKSSNTFGVLNIEISEEKLESQYSILSFTLDAFEADKNILDDDSNLDISAISKISRKDIQEIINSAEEAMENSLMLDYETGDDVENDKVIMKSCDVPSHMKKNITNIAYDATSKIEKVVSAISEDPLVIDKLKRRVRSNVAYTVYNILYNKIETGKFQ